MIRNSFEIGYYKNLNFDAYTAIECLTNDYSQTLYHSIFKNITKVTL